MGNKERPTMLDRLLELLRGKSDSGNSRPAVRGREAEPDQRKMAKKVGKRRKKG